ncbi:MAG: hypothetical protein QOI91_2771 [Solirubrobacteraceae bacterium]|jgi:hypothetical protein|nr:hypothetical protein [Solirubrobacteraceae bacterium]
MDLAQIVSELWHRRGWVLLGVAVSLLVGLSTAYRIQFLPPNLEPKALSLGAANTQILIDSPDSALTDIGRDLDPLAVRASVFARFMTSEPVREVIARQVGLPKSAIVTEAPLSPNQPAAAKEPPAATRGNQLVGEGRTYRLRFSSDQGQPTITIAASAPNARDAVRLANAGAVGFKKYMERIQATQNVPSARRVTVRQLGNAEGGTVTGQINTKLLIAAAIGALIAWCLLVLLVSNVARSLRELREVERGGDEQPTAT